MHNDPKDIKCRSLKTVNATFLGKRDFADVITHLEKERLSRIIRMGLKCNHLPLEKEGGWGLDSGAEEKAMGKMGQREIYKWWPKRLD